MGVDLFNALKIKVFDPIGVQVEVVHSGIRG